MPNPGKLASLRVELTWAVRETVLDLSTLCRCQWDARENHLSLIKEQGIAHIDRVQSKLICFDHMFTHLSQPKQHTLPREGKEDHLSRLVCQNNSS